MAIISSRDSPALHHRARELGINHVRVGVSDKVAELRDLSAALGVPLRQVCYVGDDDPDVPAMGLAGVSAAPPDAASAPRAQAAIQLHGRGGRGAVRELADLLLAELAGSGPNG